MWPNRTSIQKFEIRINGKKKTMFAAQFNISFRAFLPDLRGVSVEVLLNKQSSGTEAPDVRRDLAHPSPP